MIRGIPKGEKQKKKSTADWAYWICVGFIGGHFVAASHPPSPARKMTSTAHFQHPLSAGAATDETRSLDPSTQRLLQSDVSSSSAYDSWSEVGTISSRAAVPELGRMLYSGPGDDRATDGGAPGEPPTSPGNLYVDVPENDDGLDNRECGITCVGRVACRPAFIQRCASIKSFTFFCCVLVTVQVSYFIAELGPL